jgi:sirohydrochlorin cobaltochelatase
MRATVLTAFGVSTSAKETYLFFEQIFRKRFPDEAVYWAYSSKTLRHAMKEKGVSWESPENILSRLKMKGYTSAVLQSLHIVSGIEFDKVLSAAKQAPINVSVGMPLLTNESDCNRAIDAISSEISDPMERITVLAGHGTVHPRARSKYALFEKCLKLRYPKNVHLCMVEGEPSFPSVYEKIKKADIRNIKFVPLMFVAGEHIFSDVLGNQKESWKSRLTGFDIEVCEKGLGFNEKILEIYFDHMQNAMDQL